MAVALIVWNRSEVILLGKFCADIRQVAYYSVAFSMADQLLLGATIFGSAAGATIFAQYGRDKSRLPDLVATAFRYLALTSIPLHFISVALAVPALLFIYGNKYAGAAMVVTVAPLLCLPKAFLGPVKNLLESMEKQRYVIAATAIASVIDIGVASYLILLGYGAVGACIGSGAAQAMAIGIMWSIGIHRHKVKLPWMQLAKIVFISVLAALTAHFIAVRLTPLWAVLCGGGAALIVLFGLIYLMRVLEGEDHDRLKILSGMLPKPIIHPAGKFLTLLTRAQHIRSTSDDAVFLQDREYGSQVCAKSLPLVLFIAYYFPPDNEIGAARPYRFYKYLKRLGYECHVITAAQGSDTADVQYVADSLKANVHSGFAWQEERVIRKFFYGRGFKLNWTASAIQAGRSFLKQRKSENIIILSTSPPVSTHFAGMCLAALSGRKWIADFRDPISFVSGHHGLFQRLIAANLARLVLKRADLALANTDAMHQYWREHYSRIASKSHILWNGFDPEDVISTYPLPERQRKVLSHVGELYGGRDIRPLLNAFVRLFDSGRLAKKSILLRQIGIAEQNELPDPEFLRAAQSEGWLELRDPVLAKEARSIALDSDGLLLVQPQSAIQVPAKLYEYIRMGRPILAYVLPDSPCERILRQAGVPFESIYPNHAPDEIERRILRFLVMLDGQPVNYSSWFAETFNATHQVGVLDALIRSQSG